MPIEPMVAIEAVALDQMPPGVAEVSMVEPVMHIEEGPVMGAGIGFTVMG
jgi:hypothetical protein